MERNGYPEETYYTFSYSPVPTTTARAGGIICANTDDTQRVIGERQLAAAARAGDARPRDARTWQQACERARRGAARPIRATCPSRDLPGRARQRRAVARRRAGHCRGPRGRCPSLSLDSAAPWPFGEVLRATRRASSPTLPSGSARLPTGAWHAPADAARSSCRSPPRGETGRAGVLVIVGLNPFRLFDDDYRGFLDLVAGQIAAGDRQRARPTRRSAGAPRRWPSSTAPRRRSSPTSATSSARR